MFTKVASSAQRYTLRLLRLLGTAQTPSPPRCGDGYAALPLTAFYNHQQKKKHTAKGWSTSDRPFVLLLGNLLRSLLCWCSCFPLRGLPLGKLTLAIIALKVGDHSRVQAPSQQIPKEIGSPQGCFRCRRKS